MNYNCSIRVHFKTWSGRCNVSVKQPVFWVGLRHSASVLPIFRHPNGSFEMHSNTTVVDNGVVWHDTPFESNA
jgi:hypothetical protein